jgi:hypothetical protein
LSYFEPVNCTVEFDGDVVDFGPHIFEKAEDTKILNFVEIRKSKYTFQLTSLSNANVTLFIPPFALSNFRGVKNNETTAMFDFYFYAYPPSATMSLEGYDYHKTKDLSNTVYIQFNSTTEYDGMEFNMSYLHFTSELGMYKFEKVNDMMYKFDFNISKNESDLFRAEDYKVPCVDLDTPLPSPQWTKFVCNGCDRRKQVCMVETEYPPVGMLFIEFPFQLVIKPISWLRTPETVFDIVYDTHWAEVEMMAPNYARGPFWITIKWTEPLKDLTAVKPQFLSGPPVDQSVLNQNLTMLSETSFKMLVAPTKTGIVQISFNGTEKSQDLAGNSNEYRLNILSATWAFRVVVYSAGPPIPGQMDFQYNRYHYPHEYPPVPNQIVPNPIPPSTLTVNWAGFTTATRYDLWMTWGYNLSWPIVKNVTKTTYEFATFQAMIGVEYTVYIRAWNIWGEYTLVKSVFLHPSLDLIADGGYSIIRMPDFMSTQQTNVSFHVLIPKNGFLSVNPLKVLTFGAVDRAGGDQDPCEANSKLMKCTFLNFHIEVPTAQFVVFRKPIRLQFHFGSKGWQDPYLRPQLRYWEAYHEEWRPVSDSCPAEQVYDRWNTLHQIYEISICHLSQFALFEYFVPPSKPTLPPPPPRVQSYSDPIFFIILAGSAVGGVLICCACYWGGIRGIISTKKVNYSNLGIRSVSERLPRRKFGSERLALADMEYGSEFVDQKSPQLALPPPAHAKALENSRPVSQLSQGRPRSAMTPPPKGAPPPSPFVGKALPPAAGGIRPSSIALAVGEQGSRPVSARMTPPIIPPTPPPGAAPPPDMAPPPPPPPAARAMAKMKGLAAVGALQKSVGKSLPPLQRVVPKNIPQPLPQNVAKSNMPPMPPSASGS